MRQLHTLLHKAEHSKKHLWLLNFMLGRTIGFNKPHGFKIKEIGPDFMTTYAPYQKKNFNHLRGIHACAIATVSELAAALELMYHFPPKDFRFIMSDIQIKYHYQAKKPILAKATLSQEAQTDIIKRLSDNEKTIQDITTEVHDIDNAHIATVKTTWQIKDWAKVQTKV